LLLLFVSFPNYIYSWMQSIDQALLFEH